MTQTLASPWDTTWYAMAGIGQALVAIVVSVGAFNLRQSRKLRIIAYEERFEERYWHLMGRLSADALKGAVQRRPPNKCKDSDLQVVRSYFRLCETQLNVRASGWITDATWDLWAQGIYGRMRHYPFTRVWDEVIANPRADHLYRRLREFLDGGRDPCQLKGWARWWRGLSGPNRR
ncbi:hypothetical protein GCM10010357_54870 [Streptomyces luteireticuli]|uniref:DUF4760 domain-containing protein n=1 Tax=Streptomyces luteireticuli TaxID=173858 RepID=A0ABN0Z078_9ACTN